MSSNIEYQTVLDPSPEIIKRLETGVLDFTAEKVPLGKRQPLGALAYDEGGELVGGVTGRTSVEWLFIHVAWVHPDHQGHGVGRRLMTEIERKAIELGCIGSQVDTLSMQAPDFYVGLGYQIIGTVDNCPRGHQRHFLAKTFD